MRRPLIRRVVEALVVGVVCLWLAPLNTRTVFGAASDYVRTSAFGIYDPIVFSQVHQRPFELCEGVDALHEQSLQRVAAALPGIDASSRFEPVRLIRLVRVFNRASRAVYLSECPHAWTYYYYYANYQSYLLKVGPIIWVVDALHGSEIYVVILLVLASWFGIACLFLVTKRLSRSSLVGFASLAILWFSISRFGATLPQTDFRLNLLATFGLVGIAQFLCDRPSLGGRLRAWTLEALTAFVFGLIALLLIFCRLPPTRLDAMAVTLCVFAVAVVRRDMTVFRRAIFLLAFVTLVQYPYNRFSARLLGPVSAVNTAASDEFKLVNVVQYVNERPSHFGNFILDFNNTWIHDGDYYLRRLSPVFAFHHGYPAWGRRFLKETVLHHPSELPNAWWKRFAVQLAYHQDLSYGIYGAHATLGTAVIWLSVGVGFVVLIGGGRWSSAWPLMGLVFWEIFGLHTFLALMHLHYMYLLKGLPLLWCALPCLAVVAAREAATWRRRTASVRRAVWRVPRKRRRWYMAAGAAVLVVAGSWVVREWRKEVHVTRIWRAVHAGLIVREAFLPPDALVREIEALRDLGGEAPGTVSMYGAWALFGYLERLPNYLPLAGQPSRAAEVRRLMLGYYKRALADGPDDPHFYSYAQYFGDPDWAAVFAEGLRRFPDHPYRVMMSWALSTQVPVMENGARSRYLTLYETSVRDQLRDSEAFRPGFRPSPVVKGKGPSVVVDDGLLMTALPGEVVNVEPFATFGTDRLSVGLFLRVTDGQIAGQLVDDQGRRLGDLPAMTPADAVTYRAWQFGHVDVDPRNAHARLALVAGPQGARFVIRDLYPLIENPRWFR